MSELAKKERLLRWPEVEARVGFSKSYTYALQARGLFPIPVKLRPGGRAIGYIESEIDAYVQSRIEESKKENLTSLMAQVDGESNE
tara:strand:- start:193 stop:450 length:258 start_codon:yes stop_codon:yes gene_type:complete